MTDSYRPASWKILLAFAIIYFVWGSTYLAIRIGVREMPPFLMAGLRFTAAGLALYLWMRLTGVPSPNWREWRDTAFWFFSTPTCALRRTELRDSLVFVWRRAPISSAACRGK